MVESSGPYRARKRVRTKPVAARKRTRRHPCDESNHLNFGDRQLLASVQQAAIPLVLASDGPMNAHVNLRSAITYPKRPAEAITKEQALIAYTRTAAYAEFRDDKGTL